MTKKPRSAKGPAKGGRPEYKPTLESRQIVEEMKYCGESENVIARALGIDPDTLRKHFGEELDNGHANRRREVIGLMFKSARDGNSSNQKRLEEIGRVSGAVERVEQRAKPEPVVGKKEARQAAADSVTGKFAAPEGPKLIVSNR